MKWILGRFKNKTAPLCCGDLAGLQNKTVTFDAGTWRRFRNKTATLC